MTILLGVFLLGIAVIADQSDGNNRLRPQEHPKGMA